MFSIWLKWSCVLSLCLQSYTANSIHRVGRQDIASGGVLQSLLGNSNGVDRLQGENHIRQRRSFFPCRKDFGYSRFCLNDCYDYTLEFPRVINRRCFPTYGSRRRRCWKRTSPTTTQFSVDMSRTTEEQTSLPTITDAATINVDEIITSTAAKPDEVSTSTTTEAFVTKDYDMDTTLSTPKLELTSESNEIPEVVAHTTIIY